MVSRPDEDPDQMLDDAIARARKLVEELERQRAEVEANPPNIPPDQLAQGRHAFEMALASARRMLLALEDAAEVSPFKGDDAGDDRAGPADADDRRDDEEDEDNSTLS
jgi:hypothetical protein